MSFNDLMAAMMGFGFLLYLIGFIRNASPECKDKTRWGWYVVAAPFYIIPIGVGIHRTLMN